MRPSQGFSLVEMLVAMALLGVVLALVAGYFVRHNELTRQTQAKNEVQDKVRTVMQVVTQDLQLAGASQYVAADGATSARLACSSGTACLRGTSSGTRDALEVAYVTSLREATGSCLRVGYSFSGGSLRRAEVACGQSLPAGGGDELADNILALDVRYVCSNGNELDNYPDAGRCDPKYAYPRSARVAVVGRSDAPSPGAPGGTYPTLAGSVACPAGYACYAMEQEVLLPNFKNQ